VPLAFSRLYQGVDLLAALLNDGVQLVIPVALEQIRLYLQDLRCPMGRYSKLKKLAAAQEYCRGRFCLREAARRHDVNVASFAKVPQKEAWHSQCHVSPAPC
jgi:hypothetical protein